MPLQGNELVGPVAGLAIALAVLGILFKLYRDAQAQLANANEKLYGDAKADALARTLERDGFKKQLDDALAGWNQSAQNQREALIMVREYRDLPRRRDDDQAGAAVLPFILAFAFLAAVSEALLTGAVSIAAGAMILIGISAAVFLWQTWTRRHRPRYQQTDLSPDAREVVARMGLVVEELSAKRRAITRLQEDADRDTEELRILRDDLTARLVERVAERKAVKDIERMP